MSDERDEKIRALIARSCGDQEDAYLYGYARGHFVAEQRAISRARLGLPIERGAEPAGGDVNDYHDTETRTPGWFVRLDRD